MAHHVDFCYRNFCGLRYTPGTPSLATLLALLEHALAMTGSGANEPEQYIPRLFPHPVPLVAEACGEARDNGHTLDQNWSRDIGTCATMRDQLFNPDLLSFPERLITPSPVSAAQFCTMGAKCDAFQALLSEAQQPSLATGSTSAIVDSAVSTEPYFDYTQHLASLVSTASVAAASQCSAVPCTQVPSDMALNHASLLPQNTANASCLTESASAVQSMSPLQNVGAPIPMQNPITPIKLNEPRQVNTSPPPLPQNSESDCALGGKRKASDYENSSGICTSVMELGPERRVNTKDGPQGTRRRFQCPQCPRAFARAYNLHTHISTHDPDPHRSKPFPCPYPSCKLDGGRSFSRKHDLQRHVASVHEWDPEPTPCDVPTSISGICSGKKLRCEYCGRGFVRRDAFRRHSCTSACTLQNAIYQ